ncbi:hypothetical protein O9993_11635 [Vibrio lentus]|nr:hypothetical protein [Vibrio lentus]
MGIELDTNALSSTCKSKRLHEYKRQLFVAAHSVSVPPHS